MSYLINILDPCKRLNDEGRLRDEIQGAWDMFQVCGVVLWRSS